MFTRILVPLDGSTRAEQALPVAARIARASDGTVILAQVAAMPVDFQADEKKPPEIYSQAVEDEGRKLAVSYLASVVGKAELVGVKTETQVMYGDIAPSILDAARSLDADLIVMCSHGYTGFKRWALGSVAHKIVPHSRIPVLLLRDGGPTLSNKAMRVLVALDGSPLAETALKPVVELMTALAPAEQRSLHLMRVVDIPVSYGKFRSDAHFDQEIREDARREAHKYLATMAKRLTEEDFASANLTVTTSVDINADVAEALVHKAEQAQDVEAFDMIAMATHGRGGIQRWVMGSVTERVLHFTKLPLFIVHAIAHKDSEEQHKETTATI